MEMKDCKHYTNCDAPICPLDEATRDIAVWYKTEQICRNQTFAKEKWRINQFRIRNNKRLKDDNYYTMKVLSAIKTVTVRITGISPDSTLGFTEESLLTRIAKQKRVAQ